MAASLRPLRALRAFERGLGRGKTSWDYKRKVAAQLRALHGALPAQAFDFDPAPARAFLARLFPGYGDLRWHRVYAAASGRQAATYLPEDVFYFHVLPALNPPERWPVYVDKNVVPSLGLAPVPRVVARVVRGRLVDAERRPLRATEALERARSLTTVVVKPARASGSGRGVRRIEVAALASELDALCRDDGGDWLLEEALEQAAELAALNADSVNTYRVLTLRADSSLHVVSTVVRVGRAGSLVDNVNAGGLVVGVHDDGALNALAFTGDAVPHERHPDHGYLFGEQRVVDPRVAHEVSLAVHERIPDVDLLSFDVAMVPGPRAVLLELNVSWQGITMHQLCNGPLLGEFQEAAVRPTRVRTVGGLLI